MPLGLKATFGPEAECSLGTLSSFLCFLRLIEVKGLLSVFLRLLKSRQAAIKMQKEKGDAEVDDQFQ